MSKRPLWKLKIRPSNRFWKPNHLDWIDQTLKQHHAKWILVCGRKVIESGPTWENYPTDEKLQAIGEQYGLIPFVFAAAPMIEEMELPL